MDIDLLAGKRRQGAVTTINVAANAGAQVIMTLSTFASMVGVKSMIIRRLKVQNNGAGNTWLHIGTGAAGAVVDAMTPLRTLNNTTDDYGEGDLPGVEFTGTLMAYVDALVAGSSVVVQVEVEERG